jgi:hypothetical protein
MDEEEEDEFDKLIGHIEQKKQANVPPPMISTNRAVKNKDLKIHESDNYEDFF